MLESLPIGIGTVTCDRFVDCPWTIVGFFARVWIESDIFVYIIDLISEYVMKFCLELFSNIIVLRQGENF